MSLGPAPGTVTAPAPTQAQLSAVAVEMARNTRREVERMPTDPLLVRSADSQAMLDYWNQTDDLVGGIQAMRAAGERYLPKFSDEDANDYSYRLRLTKMTNVYRDIVENLASKPFEKEVTIVEEDGNAVPQQLRDFMENVDGSGNNLTGFASNTFFHGINSAIDWIFVDHPVTRTGKVRSIAEARAAGIRPFWSRVLGRNMLEARSEVIGGEERLTYARIFEPGNPDRVRIFERTADGRITWELRERRTTAIPYGTTETFFHPIGDGVLTIDQIPLVPFMTGRRDGRTFRCDPALRDAADLQVEVYLSESGLKFAKTLTAYPMLSGDGVAPPKDNTTGMIKKLAVGPARVLYAPPNGNGQSGSWKYVEPNAQSLKFLADDIKDMIKELRELGRQPLTAQSGQLTVITTAMAANKARSAVAQWALALKNALENALVITNKFFNIRQETYDPVVSVYVDFDEFTEGKDLETLDADRDRGDISRETLWEEKKRRGVYSEDFTPERETKRLLKEVPSDGPDADPDETAPREDE